jgi:hypothetical protein
MVRLRMDNPKEAEALLTAEGYEKHLGAHA